MIRTTSLLAAFLILAVSAGCKYEKGSADYAAAKAGEKPAETAYTGPAKVGAPAPDFKLSDTDGKQHELKSYLAAGKTVVLEWFNPDCPYIVKHHLNHSTMNDLYNATKGRDVVWLAINSGAPGKQGNGLERNRAAREEYGMEFPILIDEDGRVGSMYAAKTTPHMFVIAPTGELLYQGAIDNNKTPSTLGDVNYVKAALDQCLEGKTVQITETQPYGCSVKYASK
ncbi:MAG: redoxin domain-containing protein [Gemmatimonadetes bacterium]|nr:redoxin domain-containing protein [Gemmatimonadota bacterium]